MKTHIQPDNLTDEFEIWLDVVLSVAWDLQTHFVQTGDLDFDITKESKRLIQELYALHARISSLLNEIQFRHAVGFIEILGEPLPYSKLECEE